MEMEDGAEKIAGRKVMCGGGKKKKARACHIKQSISTQVKYRTTQEEIRAAVPVHLACGSCSRHQRKV
jgi:hypothetical protein